MNGAEIRLWHFYACPQLSVSLQMTAKRKFVLPVIREGNAYFGYLVNSRTSYWLNKRPHLLCCRAFIPSSAGAGWPPARRARLICGIIIQFV